MISFSRPIASRMTRASSPSVFQKSRCLPVEKVRLYKKMYIYKQKASPGRTGWGVPYKSLYGKGSFKMLLMVKWTQGVISEWTENLLNWRYPWRGVGVVYKVFIQITRLAESPHYYIPIRMVLHSCTTRSNAFILSGGFCIYHLNSWFGLLWLFIEPNPISGIRAHKSL